MNKLFILISSFFYFGFDFISNNGLTLMTKYTRDQAKHNKNDNFIIAFDYKNSSRSLYSMSIQDTSAKLSHDRELNNFNINIDNKFGNRSVCTKYPFPKQTLFNKIYHLIKYDDFIYIKQQNIFYFEIQIESLNQNNEDISLGFCNNKFCLVNFNLLLVFIYY